MKGRELEVVEVVPAHTPREWTDAPQSDPKTAKPTPSEPERAPNEPSPVQQPVLVPA